MQIVDLPSHEARLPSDSLDTFDARTVAAITRYGRRRYFVLSATQFDLVSPFLELLLDQGAPVSPELQMTRHDLELDHDLARDREPSDGETTQITELLDELA